MSHLVYTLGADPEFFVEHNKQLHSIEGLIGGTKDKPKPIDEHNAFKIQEDNVAAEYNIPPCNSKLEFITAIKWPQQVIAQLVGTKNFSISTKASGHFDPNQLQTKQARTFGCDPDYNAWTGEQNRKPHAKDPTFRTCGGHVHIGLSNKDPLNIMNVIRNMDKYVGVWSILADHDKKRRELYGKAGCFREQPHGTEYRTMSNFWIFSDELISEVWDRTQQAVNKAHNTDILEDPNNLIQSIINTGDKHGARVYLKTHGLL